MPYKNHEDVIRNKRKHYAENKERILDKKKEYRTRKAQEVRNSQLIIKYGISIFDYEQMLVNQNFSCAICHKHISEESRNFCVDHSHEPPDFKVRALLCRKCNSGLGLFQDSISVLEAAIDYLKQHK